jgi:hypothetical protein
MHHIGIGYEVQTELNGYGVAVFGPVPLSDLRHLFAMWKKRGYDVVDVLISKKLGATLAITSQDGRQTQWRKSLGIETSGDGKADTKTTDRRTGDGKPAVEQDGRRPVR